MDTVNNLKEDLLKTYAEAVNKPVDVLRTQIKKWDWEVEDRRLWLRKRTNTIFLVILYVLFLALFFLSLFILTKSGEIPKVSVFSLLGLAAAFAPISMNFATSTENYRLFKLVRKYFQEK